MTEKNPRQITARASKAATIDNLSQEIVSRQVFISCLDKTMATDWSSIPLNLFIETKLAAVQTLL